MVVDLCCGQEKPEGTTSAMFEVGNAAKCYEFKLYVLRLDSMLRELRELRESLSCDNHGCFSSKNMFGPSQKPLRWTERKKKTGTSSAMFGVGTGTKCCELKRCADRVRSRTQERESPQGQISGRNWDLLPSTFTVSILAIFS